MVLYTDLSSVIILGCYLRCTILSVIKNRPYILDDLPASYHKVIVYPGGGTRKCNYKLITEETLKDAFRGETFVFTYGVALSWLLTVLIRDEQDFAQVSTVPIACIKLIGSL